MTYVPPPNTAGPGPPHNTAAMPTAPTATQEVPTPTTSSQDLLAAAFAALMVLGAGLLVLFGWVAMGYFGLLLGIGGGFWWGYWWRTKHEAFFPKDLEGRSVGGFAMLVGLIGLIFVITLTS